MSFLETMNMKTPKAPPLSNRTAATKTKALPRLNRSYLSHWDELELACWFAFLLAWTVLCPSLGSLILLRKLPLTGRDGLFELK